MPSYTNISLLKLNNWGIIRMRRYFLSTFTKLYAQLFIHMAAGVKLDLRYSLSHHSLRTRTEWRNRTDCE